MNKNKFNIFLDDERVPYSPHGGMEDAYNYTQNLDYVNLDWVIVRSYDKFISHIKTHGTPQYISLDHDLADFNDGKEKTGMDCVKWLCDFCVDNNNKFPKYLIHSQNIIGSENMLAYIKNFKKFYE